VPDVTLRRLTDADAAALVPALADPSIARWWGPLGSLAQRERDLRNGGHAFAAVIGGELAGWIGYEEELEPGFKHASLDIFLRPAFQDRGYGPAALRLAARWLIDERGHHRITIDPEVANERAIRAYRAVGFRDVGVMRRYARTADGTWADNLLMDLLADELS
jgi:aminoglycoside 6'-N-acetyltransferase